MARTFSTRDVRQGYTVPETRRDTRQGYTIPLDVLVARRAKLYRAPSRDIWDKVLQDWGMK